MADLDKLSVEELKAKKKTLVMQNMGVGMIGSIAGVVYNVKTGGGFWRGVLFFFAGGFVVGIVPRMAYFIPQTNKVEGVINKKLNAEMDNASSNPNPINKKDVVLTSTVVKDPRKDLKIEKLPIKKAGLMTTRPMEMKLAFPTKPKV